MGEGRTLRALTGERESVGEGRVPRARGPSWWRASPGGCMPPRAHVGEGESLGEGRPPEGPGGGGGVEGPWDPGGGGGICAVCGPRSPIMGEGYTPKNPCGGRGIIGGGAAP